MEVVGGIVYGRGMGKVLVDLTNTGSDDSIKLSDENIVA